MMRRWMVFRQIIRQVCFSRPPYEFELLLRLTISQPMESHIHGFGTFQLNFIVDYTLRGRVVRADRCACLRVSHFMQYLP